MRRELLLCALLGLVGAASAQVPPAGLAGFLLPETALPDYERDVDHAGLIRSWNKASLERGEKIYERACHSCHGDLNLRGSLPDALAFAEGAFQHGADPHRMYQTLTRGWGKMPPQTQLVPREKYDVIHYIRETFLPHNPTTQRPPLSAAYLAQLPAGRSTGPAPARREPWREMDYGNFLIGTFEVADAADRAAAAAGPRGERDAVAAGANIAYKGIAIRLEPGPGGVAAGRSWLVFEHDTLRVAGAWTGEGFIDWEGINFNTRHVVRPRTVGELVFETGDGPGWADFATGEFVDTRFTAVDGRRFGPPEKTWGRYRGLYRAGARVVLSYVVGDAEILESHALESCAGRPVVVRTLNVGRSSSDLTLRVADTGALVAVTGAPAALRDEAGFTLLSIRATDTPARIALRVAAAGADGLEQHAAKATPPVDLSGFTHGGPPQWPEVLTTPVVGAADRGAFAWSRLTLPTENPWRSRLRLSGIDFIGDDAAVVCTWDGDVWRVDGIGGDGPVLSWRRIAAGLFQPLGIAVRQGEIFVTCRDQLVRLHDLNGDGEADYYESFNSDHQVTEHFHEFAMGLQVDAAGDFFYAKSARHARTPLVPQHGTLLRVSRDGARTDIIAHGFRAANGVCLNADGSFFVTDQEGHWMPANRVNRVVAGGFFGNMWSHGAPADTSDAAMQPPLCWIDKRFDRSPAELLWLNHRAWGSLDGALLNLSYGHGRVELVLLDNSGAKPQGAVVALPIPDFPTGLMRGRVHPRTGDLFICGLSAWASSQTLQEGGLYRLRPTGRPAGMPLSWRVIDRAIELTWSAALDEASRDPARYTVTVWGLTRSANYGSPRVKERTLRVTAARVLTDGRTLRLEVPDLEPTAGIEIACRVRGRDGVEVERVLHGTVHHVPDSPQ